MSAGDEGIDVIFRVAEEDSDAMYSGLQALSMVCADAGVQCRPIHLGVLKPGGAVPAPNRVGLRPIGNEMREGITLLADPTKVSPKEAYLYYCAQYKLKPNSDVKAQLSTEIGQYGVPSMQLGGNFLGNNGLLPLLEILRLNTALEELAVPNNGIKNAGVEWLADMALAHPTLKTIDLSRNRITLGGGKVLHELVVSNPRITSINLDDTKIDEKLRHRIQVRCGGNAQGA